MSSGADDAAPQEPGAELRRGHSPVLATVVEALPGELFRLRLEDGSERTAHVSGNMRMAFTRRLPFCHDPQRRIRACGHKAQ